MSFEGLFFTNWARLHMAEIWRKAPFNISYEGNNLGPEQWHITLAFLQQHSQLIVHLEC